MRHLVALAAVAATALSGATCSQAAHATTWYWTPGACKSALTHEGVQTSDGRVFYPAQVFCIGSATSCAWSANHTTRLYRTFQTVIRSGDGTVRTMMFHVTGKNSWSGQNLRVVFQYMDAQKFSAYVGVIAHAAAQEQNQYGCKSGVLSP